MTSELIKGWEKELHVMELQKAGCERKIATLKAKIEAGKEIEAAGKTTDARSMYGRAIAAGIQPGETFTVVNGT